MAINGPSPAPTPRSFTADAHRSLSETEGRRGPTARQVGCRVPLSEGLDRSRSFCASLGFLDQIFDKHSKGLKMLAISSQEPGYLTLSQCCTLNPGLTLAV